MMEPSTGPSPRELKNPGVFRGGGGAMLEKWFHDLSLENKFSQSGRTKYAMFSVHRVFFKNMCSVVFKGFLFFIFFKKMIAKWMNSPDMFIAPGAFIFK